MKKISFYLLVVAMFAFAFGVYAEETSTTTEEVVVSSEEESVESEEEEVETNESTPLPGPKPVLFGRPIFAPKPEGERPIMNSIQNNTEGEFKPGAAMGNRPVFAGNVQEIRANIAKRFEVTIQNLYNLHDRIEEKLALMKDAGIDTNEEVEMLSDAKSKLDSVQSEHDELKAVLESEEKTRKEVATATEEFKASLRELHGSFIEVIKSMKDKIGQAQSAS